MEFKRGFLKKGYATSSSSSAPVYTVASHPNHLEPHAYSDRVDGGGALTGQGAPTQKFKGWADFPDSDQDDIEWLRSLAKTPQEESAFLHSKILVNFDLCQDGVDRIPMWLYPGRLALMKQTTYERLRDLGGPDGNGENVLWEARKTRYAGEGLFAITTFEAGDLIIAERPLEVDAVHPPSLPSFSREGYLKALHNRRSPVQKKKYLSLFSIRQPERGVLSSIAALNRIGVEFCDDVDHYAGSFPTIARINHSCGPNSQWVWNNSTFSLDLHALRRIERDEEITVTYIDHRAPRDARQRDLQPYGFTCQCAWCSLPAEESLQSDRNRHEILTWYDNHVPPCLWDLTPLSTNESYLSEGQRILEVCKKEGVENQVDSFAKDMMVAYSMLADAANCRKYARLMLGIAKAYSVAGQDLVDMAERCLEDPQRAAGTAWGTRLPGSICVCGQYN